MNLRYPSLVALMTLIAGAVGCTAPTGEDAATAGTGSALSDPWQTGATTTVRTRELKEQRGSYCWATRQDFSVRYENRTLPENTKVELHYGDEQYGNCSDCDPTVSYYPWSHVTTGAMFAPGGSVWTTEISLDDEGGIAGGGVAALNFAFKLTFPDGRVDWDNGGTSNLGYYRAPKVDSPVELCGKPADYRDVSVWHVYR